MGNIQALGELINWVDVRNKGVISDNLLGINIDKFFMPSVANIIGTDLSSYKLIRKKQFACNPMHVGRDEKMPIALYMDDSPSIVSPAYFVFEVKDGAKINPEYLMLWFRRAEFDRECWYHTDGSVRGGITWDEILEMTVPVPSIEEQNELVKSYRDIERRIQIKKEINDNLESQMSFLFIKKFEPLSFNCDSKQHLSDIMTFDNGFAFSSSEYLLEGQYKIITIGNVCDGYIDTTNVNHLQTISDKVKRSALLYIGDIIISLTGNVGRTAIVKESNLLLNQRVARIVARDKMYKGFLYCLFRQQSTKTFLETISRGTAQANLSPVELLNTKTNYNHDDMIEFTKIVTPMINAILVNSNEIAELLIFRRAFLSELSR